MHSREIPTCCIEAVLQFLVLEYAMSSVVDLCCLGDLLEAVMNMARKRHLISGLVYFSCNGFRCVCIRCIFCVGYSKKQL
jgi:hypothetical protein